MPVRKGKKAKLLNKQKTITSRLMQFNLKLDDYLYQQAPMSIEKATSYLREAISYRKHCLHDERSLQVIEKLTRCLKGVIVEQRKTKTTKSTNTTGGNSPLPEFMHINTGCGSISPVYSLPETDKAYYYECRLTDKNYNQNDIPIIDSCEDNDDEQNVAAAIENTTPFLCIDSDIETVLTDLTLETTNVIPTVPTASLPDNYSQNILDNYESCNSLLDVNDKSITAISTFPNTNDVITAISTEQVITSILKDPKAVAPNEMTIDITVPFTENYSQSILDNYDKCNILTDINNKQLTDILSVQKKYDAIMNLSTENVITCNFKDPKVVEPNDVPTNSTVPIPDKYYQIMLDNFENCNNIVDINNKPKANISKVPNKSDVISNGFIKNDLTSNAKVPKAVAPNEVTDSTVSLPDNYSPSILDSYENCNNLLDIRNKSITEIFTVPREINPIIDIPMKIVTSSNLQDTKAVVPRISNYTTLNSTSSSYVPIAKTKQRKPRKNKSINDKKKRTVKERKKRTKNTKNIQNTTKIGTNNKVKDRKNSANNKQSVSEMASSLSKKAHAPSTKQTEGNISWVGKITCVRKLSTSECDSNFLISDDSFWDNYNLPDNWTDQQFMCM